MRANRVWTRAFAGTMVAWFGLVMAAPALLHSCPQAMSKATVAEATSGQEHAHHGAEHSGHQLPGAPANCQCLGSCAISSSAILPAPTTIAMAAQAPIPTRELSAVSEVVAAVHLDHSQPFATAPPLPIG